MVIGSREISLSDCPEAIAELAESGRLDWNRLSADDKLQYALMKDRMQSCTAEKPKKQKKRSTRFDRLEAIRRKYPGCEMVTCRVDSTRGKYAPRRTRYGDQYDMDRIIGICCADGTIRFADQDGYEVDDAMIEVREKVNE